LIYVDTSVVLAWVLREAVRPEAAFWGPHLVTSRLTEYEAWVRLHAYGRAGADGGALRTTLLSLNTIELDAAACARCFSPFPSPVRTLDALHLSAADHVRAQGVAVSIATYDTRMAEAARALAFEVVTAR
jgi:predicted nucleic acid-binding protein